MYSDAAFFNSLSARLFAGVCNYKGNIVPVVELEEEKAEGKNRDMVLITEWGKYRMGIHFSGEPYAIFATDKDKIESPEEMEPSGIWIEKDIYKRITRWFM